MGFQLMYIGMDIIKRQRERERERERERDNNRETKNEK
jgi:hypothetical protein